MKLFNKNKLTFNLLHQRISLRGQIAVVDRCLCLLNTLRTFLDCNGSKGNVFAIFRVAGS